MKPFLIRTACGIGVALICLTVTAARKQTQTSQIVTSANAFLSTLDAKQRQSVLYAFNDGQQRQRWSNLPVPFVPRGGISLKQMNAAQRSAAMALVASVLSPRGFEKVQEIMEGDEVNKLTDTGRPPVGNGGPPRGNGGPPPGNGGPPQGNGGPPPGARGGNRPAWEGPIFGKDLYYISILGTPSETSPWMLQFGGHHLALNITIAGEHGVLTPTLTGAQPALYTSNGKTVRPLGPESDKGLALLNALNETQRKQAILSYKLADLVLGPGQDGKTIEPEGLKASAMNERQRAMLLDVISEWSGINHESAAEARMAEIKAGLDETWFAWSGPTTAVPGRNITAYYRIQGPNLVIEYAPQTLGGDPSMHVHTMYRDPTNDYGRKFIAK
ncbi:MAG TPA: DUF3500 domain-containing protein [Bryobacteraceae bacterium]|jgi:hypothetical protein|nr:DUF3500 domain-containing protein [Bryobacteraceae bacterium]